MANVQRLIDTYNYIAEHPQHHFQSDWLINPTRRHQLPTRRAELKCGTAGCFAGWTSMLAGDKPVWQTAVFSYPNTDTVETPEGSVRSVSDRARELLELDCDVADVLFEGSNTLAQLRAGVVALATNPDVDEDWLATLMWGPDHTEVGQITPGDLI